VKPHLTSVRLRQLLARDHLQQQHQLEPVTEVFFNHVDLCVYLAKVSIAPGRERLQRRRHIDKVNNKYTLSQQRHFLLISVNAVIYLPSFCNIIVSKIIGKSCGKLENGWLCLQKRHS